MTGAAKNRAAADEIASLIRREAQFRSTALPQGLRIELGGCSLDHSDQSSALSKFTRVSGAEVKVSSRLKKLHGGKVLGNGDPQARECLREFLRIVAPLDL